ncbi:hypothetical protein [Dyadobacter sp. 32]|uniref:hypothetical protein n=1 Tax=Dyadobacter sp. 32 TaxID=538966 RepID=UPI0011F007A7
MFPDIGMGQVIPITFNQAEVRTPVISHRYFTAQGSVFLSGTFIFGQPQTSATVAVTPAAVSFSSDGTYDVTNAIQAQIAEGVSIQIQGSLNGLLDILRGEGNATTTAQRIANLFSVALGIDVSCVTFQFNTPNAEDLVQGFWGSFDAILDGNRLMEMLIYGRTESFEGLTIGEIVDERTGRRTWQLLRINGSGTARFRFGLTAAGVVTIGSRISALLPGALLVTGAVVLGVSSMAILNVCLANVRARGERLGVLTRFCAGYVRRVYFPNNPSIWTQSDHVFRQGVEGAVLDISRNPLGDAGILQEIATVTHISPDEVIRYNEESGVASIRDMQSLVNTGIRLAEAIQAGNVRVAERF